MTTWPSSPPATILGTNDFTMWMAPQRFTPRTHCQSSTLRSQLIAALEHPGVGTHQVDGAEAVVGRGGQRLDGRRVTDVAERPAWPRCRATVSSSADASTSAATTDIPSSTNRRTSARPIPLPGPGDDGDPPTQCLHGEGP